MEASKVGMSEHVDILVGDIYGYDDSKYAELGLKAQVIASRYVHCILLKSFSRPVLEDCRIAKCKKISTRMNRLQLILFLTIRKPDIVKSLLHMIANNISQIAYLNAKVKGVDNIFFTGGFVSENSYLWTRLSFAINFWSKGTKQVHEIFIG